MKIRPSTRQKQFLKKYTESLEEACFKADIEVQFLKDEPGNLEHEINTTTVKVYPNPKDGKKELESLQFRKQQLEAQIKKESSIAFTLSTKLEFLNTL